MSKGQCETVTKAQDAAKRQITAAVWTLSGIQSKVDAGEKLTRAENRIVRACGMQPQVMKPTEGAAECITAQASMGAAITLQNERFVWAVAGVPCAVDICGH